MTWSRLNACSPHDKSDEKRQAPSARDTAGPASRQSHRLAGCRGRRHQSKGSCTPLAAYRCPACRTRSPSRSKKRPPRMICGMRLTTRATADAGDRKSTLVLVPCKPQSLPASAPAAPTRAKCWSKPALEVALISHGHQPSSSRMHWLPVQTSRKLTLLPRHYCPERSPNLKGHSLRLAIRHLKLITLFQNSLTAEEHPGRYRHSLQPTGGMRGQGWAGGHNRTRTVRRRGARLAATVSGSSARALKKRRAPAVVSCNAPHAPPFNHQPPCQRVTSCQVTAGCCVSNSICDCRFLLPPISG